MRGVGTSTRRAQVVMAVAFCALAARVSAITPTPTPVAGSATATKGKATPTATITPTGPPLIAIDNVSATDSTSFFTDFDAFVLGTVAEDLTVPGMTFTSDPPGIWQIALSTTAFQTPLRAPFQTLREKVLIQPSTPGTLTITFASPVNNFSCTFAESQPPGTSSLVVQAYSGTTLVGSTSRLTTTGDVFGEGTVNFTNSTLFDKVRLSSISGIPAPTPTATPHSPPLNPTRSTPRSLPDGSTGLAAGTGSACAITTQDSKGSAALLIGVSFLIVLARNLRRRGAARRLSRRDPLAVGSLQTSSQ